MVTPPETPAPAESPFEQTKLAAQYILGRTSLRPRVGVVLGSGLGAFATQLGDATCIDYASIPHFPVPTAAGHAGRLIVGTVRGTIGGTVKGVAVAAMQGRVHLYEGYSPEQVIFPMRVLWQMGIRATILTNAAGGICRTYRQGSLVLLRDHINLQGVNPLAGANDARFGVRFPDLTTVHWEPYRVAAREEAKQIGVDLFDGVYAALSGPSYETPAEIRYLRTIGADLVGMSTVPEIIAAAHMGIRVLGISCVTNMAAGMTPQPITEQEVLDTGKRVQGQFAALLSALIPRIESDVVAAPQHLPPARKTTRRRRS